MSVGAEVWNRYIIDVNASVFAIAIWGLSQLVPPSMQANVCGHWEHGHHTYSHYVSFSEILYKSLPQQNTSIFYQIKQLLSCSQIECHCPLYIHIYTANLVILVSKNETVFGLPT